MVMMMMMMMRMSPRNHPQPANHRSPRTVVADKVARARRGRGHPGRPADATPSGIRPRPRRRTCTSLGVVPTTMRAALAKPPRARRGRTVWKGVQTRALARARDASAPDTPSAMPVDAEGRRATVWGQGCAIALLQNLFYLSPAVFWEVTKRHLNLRRGTSPSPQRQAHSRCIAHLEDYLKHTRPRNASFPRRANASWRARDSCGRGAKRISALSFRRVRRQNHHESNRRVSPLRRARGGPVYLRVRTTARIAACGGYLPDRASHRGPLVA